METFWGNLGMSWESLAIDQWVRVDPGGVLDSLGRQLVSRLWKLFDLFSRLWKLFDLKSWFSALLTSILSHLTSILSHLTSSLSQLTSEAAK